MVIQSISAICFCLAFIHIFCLPLFSKYSGRLKPSRLKTGLHLLSEVELIFTFWALIFLISSLMTGQYDQLRIYLPTLHLTEPLFIFCIIIITSTRPIVQFGMLMITVLSRILHRVSAINLKLIQFFCLLTMGPLLGSIITEPAAMTLTALMLFDMLDNDQLDQKLLYIILALLFVNVSVGGALTHFAAPPVLMVANSWHWTLGKVFINLGLPALATILINTTTITVLMKNQLIERLRPLKPSQQQAPAWVYLIQFFFLVACILSFSHPNYLLICLIWFLIFYRFTRTYQSQIQWRSALFVGLFLASLVILGSLQSFWIAPLVRDLKSQTLYFIAIGLTAVIDNAALTYLGTMVSAMIESSRWALVAGALVGGGLTIIANAPNPAGFFLLKSKFKNETLNGSYLLLAALFPTLVATLCFYFLGNF